MLVAVERCNTKFRDRSRTGDDQFSQAPHQSDMPPKDILAKEHPPAHTHSHSEPEELCRRVAESRRRAHHHSAVARAGETRTVRS